MRGGFALGIGLFGVVGASGCLVVKIDTSDSLTDVSLSDTLTDGFTQTTPVTDTLPTSDPTSSTETDTDNPSVCGDGSVDAGEACHDGNQDNSDACLVTYRWVITHTRYVALEFGIHGFKPYAVPQVCTRGFGDCKDKASVIVTMLREAGVEASLVLLRTRANGAVATEPASLAVFDHAIAYVPALDLFLDGTAEFHGSRDLSADRVANVLIIEPDAPSRFLTTPESTAQDNVTSLTLDVTLKPDGSATAKGSMVAKGQGAPEMRRQYQTPATRVDTFEQQWAQSFPGVTASEVRGREKARLPRPRPGHRCAG